MKNNMKLKEISNSINILDNFIKFINNINFNDYKIFGKDLYYGDDNKDFYIFCDESIETDKLKSIIKFYLKKYWKNFEEQIDFHKYDNNYFIQIKQNKNDINVWEFIIEAINDTLYVKFNSNFLSKI